MAARQQTVASDSPVDVTIRLDKAGAARLDEVVHALEGLGLEHVETHARFGIVNGSVSADRVEALRQVEGVASVREDQVYKATGRAKR